MADPARAKRLSKRISTIVASAIEYEIKDPRLAFVTITDTKVTGDLHDATVVLHGARQHRSTTSRTTPGAAAALERAKGTLRTKVGAGTGVRFTPTLAFVRDKVPDTAQSMEELLARARAADADVARIRGGRHSCGRRAAVPCGRRRGNLTGERPGKQRVGQDDQDTGDRDRLDD